MPASMISCRRDGRCAGSLAGSAAAISTDSAESNTGTPRLSTPDVRRAPVSNYSPSVTATSKRPAHRTSRRTTVVRSAMELFASPAADAITVAEIADAAAMTSAAFYYHSASKDDSLLEVLRLVVEEMVAEA